MDITGYEVTHKTFGNGTVTRYDGKYVTVRFSACEKTFVYPAAFSRFMTLSDAEAAEAVAKDLEAFLSKKQQTEEARAKERERQMRSGIVIPGNRAALERAQEGRNRKDEQPEEI